MKYFFALWIAFFSIFSSCNSVKPTATPIGIPEKEAITTIFGIVEGLENGKDGYTTTIKTPENKLYKAVISIPNLGKNGGYQRLKIGNTIAIKGEVWKLGEENRITVRKIISADTKHFKLKGIVKSRILEKGNYIAIIESSGDLYNAIFKFANFGANQSKYKVFEEDEKIHVYGELSLVGDKKQILVRDILK